MVCLGGKDSMISSGFFSDKMFLPPSKTSISCPSTSIFTKLGILSSLATESKFLVFTEIVFEYPFKYCSIQGLYFPAIHPVAEVRVSWKNEVLPDSLLRACG